jgi:hypothetical protein
MTNHSDDRKLDQLLQDWAARRQQNCDLQPLEQRILDQLSAEDAPVKQVSPASETASPAGDARQWPLWLSLGALAAALLIACTIFLLPRDGGQAPPDTVAQLPPEFAWLQESQLAEKAALLREMDRVFDGRLQWVVETDGRVLLEVQSPADSGNRTLPPATYMIRIVVARQDSQQASWAPVWAADVVARQEDQVRLTDDSSSVPEGVELALWVYPVDDDMVAVDLDLALDNLPIESYYSGIQEPGVPLAVHATKDNDEHYQVFQTVVRLNGEV